MIHRLLVANRGEVARRIFTTCRLIGIETVAVYSDADADSPHVAEADYAVHLPGNAATATYLRADLILAAARKTAADAVHPGYGMLAERADFATAVIDAGLTWVGPSPTAISTLSSRLATKDLLAGSGVPVLPSYSDPAEAPGFPLIVKTATGSDGRGIRVVRDAEALTEAFAAVRREATGAGGAVYAEPYVEGARQVAVQIFADSHGNHLTFGERETTIQRGHREILAETPSPAVSPALRQELCTAAVTVARAAGYVGAGSVEFLLAPNGSFYVLRMKARLQAEHSVTECVAGVDLVRLQLLAAEGLPLPFTSPPPIRGHAIEVRICAEDPAYAWLPSTGTVHRFRIPDVATRFHPPLAPGLRLDPGVDDGSTVSLHYDSTLAKLVAWAPTRYEAARLLAAALARSEIHGPASNRDLLVRVLRHPDFLDGGMDTAFLERRPEVFAPLLSSVDGVRLSCLAAALAESAARRTAAPVLAAVPPGWRNVPAEAQTAVYEGPTGPVEVGYRRDRTGALAGWWTRAVDPDELDLAGLGPDVLPGGHPAVAIVSADPTEVVLDVAGIRLAFRIHRIGDVSYVDSSEGSVALTELPRFPEPPATHRAAPSTGGVVPAGATHPTAEQRQPGRPTAAAPAPATPPPTPGGNPAPSRENTGPAENALLASAGHQRYPEG